MADRRGISSLELIVALGVGAPLLVLIVTILLSAVTRLTQARIRYSEQVIFERASSYLSQVVDDTDGHRLDILPRVHSLGRITFTDGTPISIKHFPLSEDSTAVSGIQLDIRGTHVTRSAMDDGSALVVCPRFGATLPFENPRSYLGISPDGIKEVIGDLNRDEYGQGCRLLRIKESKSIIVPNSPKIAPGTFRTIIPIVRIYSIIVTKDGELRYLSHRGEAIIENQPIRKGIKAINAGIESNVFGMVLHTKITLPSNRSIQLHFTTSLSRQAPELWLGI